MRRWLSCRSGLTIPHLDPHVEQIVVFAVNLNGHIIILIKSFCRCSQSAAPTPVRARSSNRSNRRSFLSLTHSHLSSATEKTQHMTQQQSVQLIVRSHFTTAGAAVAVNIVCEQNRDSSKLWVSTGSTANHSTCHGDDNHWADI